MMNTSSINQHVWQPIRKISTPEPGAIPGCAIPDAALEVTVNQVWIYYFDFKQFRHSRRNRNRKENGGRKTWNL